MSKSDLVFTTTGREQLRISADEPLWPSDTQTPSLRLEVGEMDDLFTNHAGFAMKDHGGPRITGQPQTIGWWRMPNTMTYISTQSKPSWLTRTFMRVLGWEWKEGETP